MKRPIAFAILTGLMVVVIIGSLTHVPSRFRNRFQPIPAHAQVVYSNEDPGWFISFFPMLGKSGDVFSEGWKQKFPRHSLARASGWQYLEKSPLTVATVSFGGREGRDAWVAVSEIGGPASLALRWRLLLFPPEGVSVARPYAVWPIWKFEHPSLPVWARVRFALTDGLLICSISSDSHDMYRLIDVLDGRAASLADRREP